MESLVFDPLNIGLTTLIVLLLIFMPLKEDEQENIPTVIAARAFAFIFWVLVLFRCGFYS